MPKLINACTFLLHAEGNIEGVPVLETGSFYLQFGDEILESPIRVSMAVFPVLYMIDNKGIRVLVVPNRGRNFQLGAFGETLSWREFLINIKDKKDPLRDIEKYVHDRGKYGDMRCDFPTQTRIAMWVEMIRQNPGTVMLQAARGLAEELLWEETGALSLPSDMLERLPCPHISDQRFSESVANKNKCKCVLDALTNRIGDKDRANRVMMKLLFYEYQLYKLMCDPEYDTHRTGMNNFMLYEICDYKNKDRPDRPNYSLKLQFPFTQSVYSGVDCVPIKQWDAQNYLEMLLIFLRDAGLENSSLKLAQLLPIADLDRLPRFGADIIRAALLFHNPCMVNDLYPDPSMYLEDRILSQKIQEAQQSIM